MILDVQNANSFKASTMILEAHTDFRPPAPLPRSHAATMQGQVSVAASKALAAEALSDRYLDLRALLKLLTKLTQVDTGCAAS